MLIITVYVIQMKIINMENVIKDFMKNLLKKEIKNFQNFQI